MARPSDDNEEVRVGGERTPVVGEGCSGLRVQVVGERGFLAGAALDAYGDADLRKLGNRFGHERNLRSFERGLARHGNDHTGAYGAARPLRGRSCLPASIAMLSGPRPPPFAMRRALHSTSISSPS